MSEICPDLQFRPIIKTYFFHKIDGKTPDIKIEDRTLRK